MREPQEPRGIPEHGHEPVMVEEVLHYLRPTAGESFLDCTLGRGGHALAVAARLAPGGTLIGLDVDPANIAYARQRLVGAALANVQLRTFHANFAEAGDVLAELALQGVDGLLADFGPSTNQLLDRSHGLSFSADAPLDMRLDPRIREKASDLLARWDEGEMAAVLHDYAQERHARRIARKIAQSRAAQPILTTGQLARLVRSVVPAGRGRIDPATRTFQALRMAVNSELQALEGLLDAAPRLLNPGGRAAFISFHSGEDRLVKQAVRKWEQAGRCAVLTPKPAEASAEEMNRNPRSRSAKLRAIVWKV